MNILNLTPFPAAPLAGRLNFPGHSLTVIVKATFDLKSGGKAVPATEQLFPTGQEHYPDDEEKKGGPRYESDFAFDKPKADLLLVGAAYAPGGKPIPTCQATFQVGDQRKTLSVIGDRHWEKNWLSWKTTEAVPFTRMELRYENSFGGDNFPANPIGKGFADVPDAQGGKRRPLPNIEDPTDPILSHGNRPAPAGFGPLGASWADRRNKLGTYKGAYRKNRWPWFPEDFDWTHFNAAPPDLQRAGFLRGDESLVFENLHAKHARYEARLPGLRLRCFLETTKNAPEAGTAFSEVSLKLDTLWVDMEAEKLVLVWRGWAPVTSEDFEEVQQLCVLSETVENPPASVEQCRRQFQARLAAEQAATAPEAPAPDEPAAPAPATEPSAAEIAARQKAGEAAQAALATKVQAQMTAICAQLGVDLNSLPAGTSDWYQAVKTGMTEQLTAEDPATMEAPQEKKIEAALHQALSKLGIDSNNLPALSDKAKAEHTRLLQELGFHDPQSAVVKELAESWTIIAAVLPHAGFNPEDLSSLINQVKTEQEKLGAAAKPVPSAPVIAAPPTPASIKAQLAAGEDLTGADLQGLDFSGEVLTGANFAGANLTGAKFRQASLQQANFTGSILAGVDFTSADLTQANAATADFSAAKLRQAILKEADFTGANLTKADLTKAVMDGTILEEANLHGAGCAECSAVHTIFSRSDLTGTDFKKSRCLQADFTKAKIGRANFQEADLTEASLNGAIGPQVDFSRAILTKLRANDGCDLTGAKLNEVRANGSIWKGANLTGTDFRHAQLEEAIFTSARLAQANLSAANLKQARFNKANLREARLLQVNLFQGNLEKANLTQTDLSGSNLYEAEFLDAIFDRTVAEGANVKMTKLEPV